MSVSTWTPPDDPDPWTILHSAADDERPAKYDRALAKYLWFHKHALQYEPALSAVRLSFAIAYWLDLAAVYPPARDAFVRTRDEAESAFRFDFTSLGLFQEVASLNSRLGKGLRTADLFEEVAQKDREVAQKLYHVAERHLIAAGRFRACGQFLDPERRLAHAAEGYRLSKQFEESRPVSDVPPPPFARRQFVDDVATLVALLVINDRAADAENVYANALKTLNDDDFCMTMDAAMTGHLPNSQPY